ncbi:membrane protein of unknown function [Cardinium endosymbiont cEper1 of Encarsia pergandiella]|uniref:sodium:solute symporter family protein n=1 Tax=Cardinium endosymbiont of Encarsia pergandiella TaxID=249402 RepID=UPI00027EA8D9|nr:membrane protein [Cardinium endosymbiont of Encarsia pergandiella]CCM09821.1 membrane protein of unknown function [Cardinium endosymbiont cEper1 of Encarsia pergandiella]
MSVDFLLVSFAIFLLCTLLVSLCTLNRNKKVTNFVAHAIGHKQFSTFTIVATIAGVHCTGPLLHYSIVDVPSKGVFYIAYRIGITLFPLLFLSWLSGRMHKFMDNLSMPETMATAYGSCGRLITALFEVANAVIIISLQIHVIYNTASRLIPSASPLVVTILIAIVMVVYAMFGGARAIALTDVWQCTVFTTLLIVLTWLVFKQTGQPIIEMIDFLQDQKQFELHNLMPSDGKVKSILRYLSFIFSSVSPYLVHNVYIASSPTQARKAFLYAGIFCTAIVASMLVVGLFSFVRFPNIPSKDIWDYFLAHASPHLKGMVCLIILACAMSTVDSRLHVVGIMFAYDIPKSIPFLKRFVYPHQLLVARLALLLVAVFTLVLSFNSLSILRKILAWYGRLYVPILMAPFILVVLDFRTTLPVALIGMVTGLLSVFAWHKWIFPILRTDSSQVPCMLMTSLAMIVVHYLVNRQKKIRSSKKKLGSI